MRNGKESMESASPLSEARTTFSFFYDAKWVRKETRYSTAHRSQRGFRFAITECPVARQSMLAFFAIRLWQENSGALFLLCGMPKETFSDGRPKNSHSPFPSLGIVFTDKNALLAGLDYCGLTKEINITYECILRGLHDEPGDT
jgi:hypothetical protein